MGVKQIEVMEEMNAGNCAVLERQLTDAAADESVVVIVLKGRTGIFCRGLEFSSLINIDEGTGEKDSECDALPVAQAFANLLKTILSLPKPLIAEVDGEARGGGVGLAAACDAVVASKRASFGLPETLFGLVPAIIMPVLLQRMMPQQFRLLALRGRSVDARQAQSLGLVDVVAEREDLSITVAGLARELGRPDPQAVLLLKQYMQEQMECFIAPLLNRGARLTASLLRQRRNVEAIKAFVSDGILPGWRVEMNEPTHKERRTKNEERRSDGTGA